MAFLDLARSRCSIRAFAAAPVPEDALRQVLEAGRLAPSACNRQPWWFVVAREPGLRAQLAEAYPRAWFRDAPVVIVVCGDTRSAWVRRADAKRHLDVDVAIATDHMTLAAADLGLGTCWVCAFDPAIVRRALALPDYAEPIVLLPLGRPAEPGGVKDRKPLDQVVRWDRFTP